MFEVIKERRSSPRYNHQLPVQYKNMKALSNSLIGALVMNMSEGGMRFIGNEFLSLANRLVLTIFLPTPSHTIKVISKVAWIRKIPMGEQYEIGSQFLTMSDEDREELRNYIEKVLAPQL